MRCIKANVVGIETFRNPDRPPSYLAKVAASVDGISGGRLEMGIGAGWYEAVGRSCPLPAACGYTDGGTLPAEPVGRVLTAARNVREATAADHHVTLLVDPRASTAPRST